MHTIENSPIRNVDTKTGAMMNWSARIFLQTVKRVAPGRTLSRKLYHTWLIGPVNRPKTVRRPVIH